MPDKDKISELRQSLEFLVQGVQEIPRKKVLDIHDSKSIAESMQDYYDQRQKWIDHTEAKITQLLLEEKQKAWISLHQNASCCKNKHQTFYGAVVTSPQWELWREKQSKNPTRDMPEVEELGVMSSDHFQEFMTFCTRQLQDFYVPGRKIGLYKIVERTKEKSHKNRKYKVECIKCGKELFRYSNKFKVKHKDCYPEKLEATLKEQVGTKQ